MVDFKSKTVPDWKTSSMPLAEKMFFTSEHHVACTVSFRLLSQLNTLLVSLLLDIFRILWYCLTIFRLFLDCGKIWLNSLRIPGIGAFLARPIANYNIHLFLTVTQTSYKLLYFLLLSPVLSSLSPLFSLYLANVSFSFWCFQTF